MEQVGSPEQVLADVRIKEDRVRAFLEREGLDALVLGRQDNFAWLTAGGDNRVVTTSEMGFGYLVVTQDRKWLVSHSMDGQRFIEEQVPGQGYKLVTSYWHQASPEQKALNLTRGMAVIDRRMRSDATEDVEIVTGFNPSDLEHLLSRFFEPIG